MPQDDTAPPRPIPIVHHLSRPRLRFRPLDDFDEPPGRRRAEHMLRDERDQILSA